MSVHALSLDWLRRAPQNQLDSSSTGQARIPLRMSTIQRERKTRWPAQPIAKGNSSTVPSEGCELGGGHSSRTHAEVWTGGLAVAVHSVFRIQNTLTFFVDF